MNIKLRFENGAELAITDYTRLEVNRQGKQVHINLTHDSNMAFNGLYDEILGLLGDDETFSIIIESGGIAAVHKGMAASYYQNSDSEMLHFSKS